MSRIWKAFKRKFLTDRADSILVPAMILAPVMALCLGMAVELVKNNYIRTERVNAIQDSVSAAVGLANTQGSLNWSVVDKIVTEYEHNRFGKKMFNKVAGIGEDSYDDSTRETANGIALGDVTTGKNGCLVGRGDDADQKYPQYKVTLDTGRGENFDPITGESRSNPVSVNFTRTQPSIGTLNSMAPLTGPGKVDKDGKPLVYRSVTVEIIDQTPNIIMGIAGAPCQKFTLSASAVTFSADADLS